MSGNGMVTRDNGSNIHIRHTQRRITPDSHRRHREKVEVQQRKHTHHKHTKKAHRKHDEKQKGFTKEKHMNALETHRTIAQDSERRHSGIDRKTCDHGGV